MTTVNEEPMPTDAHPLLVEHARGDSYRQIGRAHALSHEAARQTVLRESSAFLNQVEMDLMLAWKLEQQGARDRLREHQATALPLAQTALVEAEREVIAAEARIAEVDRGWAGRRHR